MEMEAKLSVSYCKMPILIGQLTEVLFYSIEKQVKDMVHRAFWDAFQEKISEDPPDFSQAIVLIQEVKEVGIVSLL